VDGFLWLVSALAVLTLALHLAARLWYVPRASWMFDRLPWLPMAWYEPLQEGEPVQLSTRDGVGLRGTYLPSMARERQGVILFCHELNGDRWNVRPYAQQLRRQGFDLLTFDFRNHGTSDRSAAYEPTPWVTTLDLADVQAAIDYLAARPDADPRGIGLLGAGKGAAVGVCVAAADRRVKVLVAEGLYSTRPFGARLFARLARLPLVMVMVARLVRLIDDWARFMLGRRRGYRFVDVDRAACRATQPILLIHGRHDRHVPQSWIQWLQRRMVSGTRLWVIEGAQQATAVQAARQHHCASVARFLHRHFAAEPVHDARNRSDANQGLGAANPPTGPAAPQVAPLA
jgi:pimeloyl-ACP methyl ester carboxylesterase